MSELVGQYVVDIFVTVELQIELAIFHVIGYLTHFCMIECVS